MLQNLNPKVLLKLEKIKSLDSETKYKAVEVPKSRLKLVYTLDISSLIWFRALACGDG